MRRGKEAGGVSGGYGGWVEGWGVCVGRGGSLGLGIEAGFSSAQNGLLLPSKYS